MDKEELAKQYKRARECLELQRKRQLEIIADDLNDNAFTAPSSRLTVTQGPKTFISSEIVSAFTCTKTKAIHPMLFSGC